LEVPVAGPEGEKMGVDRPVHEVTMNSDFLTSLAFHGHGGPIPPLLELFCPAPAVKPL
jgi:hypothetical protein